MLIECLIEREGGTPVQVGQTRLYFCPRPELTQGDTQSNVCEVNMKEIWDYLLATSQGNFVQYQKGSTYGGRKKVMTWQEQAAIQPQAAQQQPQPVAETDNTQSGDEAPGLHARLMKLEEENLDLKAELEVADKAALDILTAAIENFEPPEGWQPEPLLTGKLFQISNLIKALSIEIEELKKPVEEKPASGSKKSGGKAKTK